jgi:thiamine biosynthesis lipoprotein
MPLAETLPIGPGCAQWPVWGSVARIVVADPDGLAAATALVRDELSAVDAAASRFRSDSEIWSVHRAGGQRTTVSPVLAELVRAALDAAHATDGDVDPTLGATLVGLGYDRDFAALANDIDGNGHVPATVTVRPVANWRAIELHGRELTVPAGILLDLGAVAKAWTADRCAALVAARCDTAVLVALGGDIATAGPAHDTTASWRIRVQDGPGEPAGWIDLPAGAAVATSSTIARTWRSGSRRLHHVLDPRSGWPAAPTWRTASVAAYTCVRANTLSTAALVRGTGARGWLDNLGAPARLVAADGYVTTLGTWPNDPGTPPAELRSAA